ncbi:MAG: type II secretion system F family protein [Coriobacteriales bacterium]
MELNTWRGLQIASFAAGTLLAAATLLQGLSAGHAFSAVISLCLGAAAPTLLLHSLTRDRKTHIRKSMASNLELLSITVRSGYPLERGLKLVANSSSGPLSEEFKQVDADINLLGMSMERSLGRMAQRCDVPEVSTFCSALIQASRQGTSITRVLDSQARLARSEHYAALQEKVNKLPAKLVVPIFGIMALIIVIALVPPVYQTVLIFMDSYTGTGANSAVLFG